MALWERIIRAVQADADAEGRADWNIVTVDSTTCRAHQHAAGAATRVPKVPGRRRSPARHRPDEGLWDARRAGSLARSSWPGEVGAVRSDLSSRLARGDAPQMIPVLEEIRVPRQAGGRSRT